MRRILVLMAALATIIGGAAPALADHHAPEVLISQDRLTVEAESASGTWVGLDQMASVEAYPGNVSVDCSDDQFVYYDFTYALFPLGITTVNCEAVPMMWAGDSTPFNLTVEVVGDTEPPLIEVVHDPLVRGAFDDTMGGNPGFGTWVILENNISYISEPLTVGLGCVSDPYVDGNWFEVGTYAITCSATDLWGNTGYGGYTLEVVDPHEYFGYSIAVTDARVNPRTGIAYVTVEATANQDGWMQAGGWITQYFANRFAIQGGGDSGWSPYSAGDVWTQTIAYPADNGKFGGGRVEIRLDARICENVMGGICDWTGSEGLTITTNLRGGYKG